MAKMALIPKFNFLKARLICQRSKAEARARPTKVFLRVSCEREGPTTSNDEIFKSGELEATLVLKASTSSWVRVLANIVKSLPD